MHDTIIQGARLFFVHLTGGGLADIRYAITHFRSRSGGVIILVHA